VTTYYAGLDLGQSNDYTALAIIEQVELPKGEPRTVRIEHPAKIPWMRRRMSEPGPMERSLLGLDDSEYQRVHGGSMKPWPTIVEERVVQDSGGTEYHLRHLERAELGTSYVDIVAHVLSLLDTPPLRGQTTLLVDRTGVGRGVYDLFARSETRATVIPITIHAGDTVTREMDGSGGYRVSKRDLVGCLQVLLQQQRLRIADGLPLGCRDAELQGEDQRRRPR